MPDRARLRIDSRVAVALALVAGLVAIGLAMVAGLASDALQAIASPPPIVRAGLAGIAIVLGGWLLVAAVRKIDSSMRREDPSPARDADPANISGADLGALVRGVRLVFLAAAAFTAAAGWILGHPLPIVIALVIAGVDVVETSFLLLVASRRGA